MVIGNGFFSDTLPDAIQEMELRAQSNVALVPLPVNGNIAYYISERGHTFGVQQIGSRYIIRQKKNIRLKKGWSMRWSSDAKDHQTDMCLCMYNAFVVKAWQDKILPSYKDGNQYNCILSNLYIPEKVFHQEYVDRMNLLADVYKDNFRKVCYFLQWRTGINFEDAKDITSEVFLNLTTTGYNPTVYLDSGFVGLWKKNGVRRTYDFFKHKSMNVYDTDLCHSKDKGFEIDLIPVLHGTKRQNYVRHYIEGYSHSEIAKITNSKTSTVRSECSRAMKFLKRYLNYYENGKSTRLEQQNARRKTDAHKTL